MLVNDIGATHAERCKSVSTADNNQQRARSQVKEGIFPTFLSKLNIKLTIPRGFIELIRSNDNRL